MNLVVALASASHRIRCHAHLVCSYALAHWPAQCCLTVPRPPVAAVRRAQVGYLPLHYAAANNASEAVVGSLVTAYPEGAAMKNNVRGRGSTRSLRPTPLPSPCPLGGVRALAPLVGDRTAVA